ncbi:alpha-N-acetylglucosaminidase [Paraferrimonas sp. SM1919]|uniref:alpha-N-acetylglucosaminidase n=1 Tax=Paraferrimonas sp. SM1919 TaxID=2662263 RepID=UPI0013D8CFCA|nr:alpha-N-acetylglucosaminidase [Paraferrimonas sp. SM1919]
MISITNKLITVLALSVALFGCSKPLSQANHTDATLAAAALINRVTPSIAGQFILEEISAEGKKDVYELEWKTGQIILRGNNGVSLASAYNHYLAEVVGVHYSLWGEQMNLPKELPSFEGVIRNVNQRQYRHFFNYCTFNYTASWWDWAEWQRTIDFLAMNGVNMPLSIVGVEAVWYHTMIDLGLSDLQAREFLSSPVYLNWQWMSNLEGTGGPLPKSWIDSHEKLAKQIMDRQLALGMTPIVNGFSGHVPRVFKEAFPEARIDLKKGWARNTFDGAAQLDPTDPLFAKVGKIYLENQIKRIGASRYFMTDPFHEGKPPVEGDEYLLKVGQSIANLLTSVQEDAIWVMQDWSLRRALLDGVDNDKMMIMNLNGSRWQNGSKRHNIPGAKDLGIAFTVGQLNNFGGRTHMHGDLEHLASNTFLQAKKVSDNVVGTGMWMEGMGANPVNHHLALAMNWQAVEVDLDSWIAGYISQRYRKNSESLTKAWQYLIEGPYSKGGYGYSSMVAARPAINAVKSGPNRNLDFYYDSTLITKAWALLLEEGEALSDVAGYRFDVVDLGRQNLANLAAVYQRNVSLAYLARDKARFNLAQKKFINLLEDIDSLLATEEKILLGKWLADAQAWGTSDEERAYMRSQAAALITVWGADTIKGEQPYTVLYDYAWREWAGLVDGFYKKRWQIFFDGLNETFETGQWYQDSQPTVWGRADMRSDALTSKIADFEFEFAANPPQFSSKPVGDTVTIAKALLEKYYDDLMSIPAKGLAPLSEAVSPQQVVVDMGD